MWKKLYCDSFEVNKTSVFGHFFQGMNLLKSLFITLLKNRTTIFKFIIE